MSENNESKTESKIGRLVRRRILGWLLVAILAFALVWGVALGISRMVEGTISMVTRPVAAVVDVLAGLGNGAVDVVDTAAENAVESLEKGTQTQSWELVQVEPIGDLYFDPVECPARAEVNVLVTLKEVHGRLVFGTDSDTFRGVVPVTVRPCIYLDAVSVSPDGKVITVDASKMHFDPDPHAVEFMIAYLANRNPGNESGLERLIESGWMSWLPVVGLLQGTLNDPERTEISGILIALGESAAANSACISEMWEGVKAFTVRFYEEQAARQHRSDVIVRVIGEPDVFQNDHLLESLLEAARAREIDIDATFEDIGDSCTINYEQ